jgi:hypothetical protein
MNKSKTEPYYDVNEDQNRTYCDEGCIFEMTLRSEETKIQIHANLY